MATVSIVRCFSYFPFSSFSNYFSNLLLKGNNDREVGEKKKKKSINSNLKPFSQETVVSSHFAAFTALIKGTENSACLIYNWKS